MSVLFLASKKSDIMLNEMVGFTATDYLDTDFTSIPGMGGYIIDGSGSYYGYIPLEDQTTLGETMWFHCRLTINLASNKNLNSGTCLQFYDTAKTLVAELYTVSGGLSLRLFGNTTVVSDAVDRYFFTTATGYTTYTFDIALTVSATDLTMTLYMNGGLSHTITVSNTTAVRLKIDKIKTIWNKMYGTYSCTFVMSEVIITENEPTIGWRLASLEPDAQGTYTQWIGDYTALDFNIYGAFMYAAETGLRESWEVTSYLGPTSGIAVRGVFMKYTAQAGNAGGPQSLAPMVVLGGTPYEVAAQTLPQVQEQFMCEWALNPATAAAWVAADFTGIEFGVRSNT